MMPIDRLSFSRGGSNRRYCATAAKILGSTAVALVLAACATQPVAQPHGPGFLTGLLHGFFVLISLLGSLFYQIRIYAFPNGGFWYDAGFAIGFGANIALLLLLSIARIGGFITRKN